MTDQGGSQITGAPQRRNAPRHKLFEPVTLHLSGIETRAHFLDLSSSGALVHSDAPPPPGAYVGVHAPSLETSGRVRWVNGKRFGMQFSQLLTVEVINKLIRPR